MLVAALIGSCTPQQPQPGMPIQMVPGQQPGAGGQAKTDRHGQTVVSAADERTNTVVLMGAGAPTQRNIDNRCTLRWEPKE